MKEKQRIQLSDHFTYGRLFKFVYPSILMMVFVSIYGVVDGIFVSNFVGKTPFAALNLIMPVLMIIGSLGFMLSTGGSAVVAKTLGEGDRDKAQKYFSMLVYVTFAGGVFFMIVGQIFLRSISELLGAEGEMLEYCIRYGRIILCSIPFFMLQFLFQELFITAEKPNLGFYLTLAAGCANIVLDALFIVVFNWGIEGAAAATATSEFIGGIVPVIYFSRKNNSLLRLRRTRIYWRVLGKASVNGCSELMSHISSSIVTVLFNMQLLRLTGEDGVAAYGVIMYICFIFVAVFLGYSIGSAPVISFNYGSGNNDEMKNIFKKSIKIMGIFGAAMVVVCFFFAEPLSKIFVGYDVELLKLTVGGLRIYAFSFLMAGLNIFGSALFTALNNGVISAVISFLRTLVFECGSVLLLPVFFGITGVWCSIIVAEFTALTVTSFFIIKNRHRYKYM